MFRYCIVSNFLQVAIFLEVYSLEKYTGKMKKDKKLCKKKKMFIFLIQSTIIMLSSLKIVLINMHTFSYLFKLYQYYV